MTVAESANKRLSDRLDAELGEPLVRGLGHSHEKITSGSGRNPHDHNKAILENRLMRTMIRRRDARDDARRLGRGGAQRREGPRSPHPCDGAGRG